MSNAFEFLFQEGIRTSLNSLEQIVQLWQQNFIIQQQFKTDLVDVLLIGPAEDGILTLLGMKILFKSLQIWNGVTKGVGKKL